MASPVRSQKSSDIIIFYTSERPLNTSLCEIFDHKASFLLVKTVIQNSSIRKRRTDIIDLSYNIEESLAANDYFNDYKLLKL